MRGNCQILTFSGMPNQTLFLLSWVFWGLFYSANAQNDKQVLGDAVFTPTEIAEGVSVTYLIRFQNFGLDTANNVVVRDTLDPRFDASTFEMLDASHNYQLLRDQGFLRWYFNGIRLPATQSAAGDIANSTGFVLYTISPQRFLEAGQTILNNACISFDEEAPICTNAAAIWIDEDSGAPEPSSKDRHCKIVPNPNFGHFQVQKLQTKPAAPDDVVEWWISDMNGKTIWDGAARNIADAPNEVMMERPTPGLYMLWMKENGALSVAQFAVIR